MKVAGVCCETVISFTLRGRDSDVTDVGGEVWRKKRKGNRESLRGELERQ